MPRRPVPPDVLTVDQIRREITRVINELQALGSDYNASNGQLRFRIKQLERDLRDLRRRLRTLRP